MGDGVTHRQRGSECCYPYESSVHTSLAAVVHASLAPLGESDVAKKQPVSKKECLRKAGVVCHILTSMIIEKRYIRIVNGV